MFHYYGGARVRSTVGVIGVISIVLRYLEVSLRGEVGVTYSSISILLCRRKSWTSSLCWARPLAFHCAIRRNLAIAYLVY